MRKLLSEGGAARAVQAAENDPEIPVILADFIAGSDKFTDNKKTIAILIKLLDRKEPSIRGDAAKDAIEEIKKRSRKNKRLL